MGLNLCQYCHLRTHDAPFLALACPMPGLVGTLLEAKNIVKLLVDEGVIAHSVSKHSMPLLKERELSNMIE